MGTNDIYGSITRMHFSICRLGMQVNKLQYVHLPNFDTYSRTAGKLFFIDIDIMEITTKNTPLVHYRTIG